MADEPLNWGCIVGVAGCVVFWIALVCLFWWLDVVILDWVLIALVALALIAIYFVITHTIDSLVAYWRAHKEER